jgi:hypothetical protein
MTTNPHAVLTDSDRTVPVSRDLAYEIAAVSAAILDAREEKTRLAKVKNLEIKGLEKRQRELIEEIRSSGDTQLVMKFGSSVNTERALAQSAPTGGDEGGAPAIGDDDPDDLDKLPDADDERDEDSATAH